MSIYKGYGGYGSPAQNERRYEELCEAYADAKERVEELESEVDELKDRIEDYNTFGSELLVDLIAAFYESEAMEDFKKCFDADELENIEIEGNYRRAVTKED